MDITTDLGCGRATDPDMALVRSLGLDVTMALKHLHGLGWYPRYWASSQPLISTGTMDINADPDCGWTMDPDTALTPVQST